MGLQDLGALGEAIGGIAVIFTLIYLAIQVRQNTRATAAQAELNSDRLALELTLPVALDRDFARLVHSGAAGVELDGADQQRYRLFVRLQMQSHMNFFYRHRDGLVSDQHWNYWRGQVRTFAEAPGFATVWKSMADDFPAEFRSYMDGLIADAAGRAAPPS